MNKMAKELGWPVGLTDEQRIGRGGDPVASKRGCAILPLTVTRRCGKAIVKEANKIVPDFKAHESNPEGRCTTCPSRRARRGTTGRLSPAET